MNEIKIGAGPYLGVLTSILVCFEIAKVEWKASENDTNAENPENSHSVSLSE